MDGGGGEGIVCRKYHEFEIAIQLLEMFWYLGRWNCGTYFGSDIVAATLNSILWAYTLFSIVQLLINLSSTWLNVFAQKHTPTIYIRYTCTTVRHGDMAIWWHGDMATWRHDWLRVNKSAIGYITCAVHGPTYQRMVYASMVLHALHGPARGAWSCTHCIVLHALHGSARGAWSSTRCMLLHACMVQHAVYGPARGVWSCTHYMVHHAVYGPARGVWSCTRYMVHHAVYGPARGVLSCTQCMVLHALHGPPRGV